MNPTRFAAGHAAHADWRLALARALDALLLELRAAGGHEQAGRDGLPEYTLGFCYLSDRFAADAEGIVAELQRRLPGVHWVGTVGIGVAATGAEHFDEPALALMLAPLPRRAFRVFSGVQPLRADAEDFHPHTALVHADGRTPDLQELLPELAERTASGYLFGGLTASRGRSVQIADGVFDGGGLSGVAFSAEVGVISRVTQGCQPIGPRRLVSRARDNFVITLDGRGALDCVMEDLGLPPDMALEPVADLRRIAREIRDELVDSDRVALGAVYVSCSGRGGPHFGRPAAELELIRDVLGDVPLAGFFAGGEIAHSRLYGYTGVLTVFAAAR